MAQLPDYPITRLPNYPITRLPNALSPSDPPLVFDFEDVGRVQIEGRRGPRVFAAELGMTAIADGQIFQATVDDEIDERGRGEDGVCHEILAEPVERPTDEGADDDHGEADFGIEIFARVEIGAVTDVASIDAAVRSDRFGDRQRNLEAAASTFDGRRRIGASNRQARVAPRAFRENLHVPYRTGIILRAARRSVRGAMRGRPARSSRARRRRSAPPQPRPA